MTAIPMRKYGLEITTSKRTGSETTSTVSFAFISNCTLDGSSLQCGSDAISTNSLSFSPGGVSETVEMTYYDQDIGNVDYLYLILDGSSTDAWFFNDFSILAANGEWRDCSFNFMNYWGLDNDCTPGGHPYVTIDVSNNSDICHTRGTYGGSGIDISVSTTNGTRTYAGEFSTANKDSCVSTGSIDWYFVNNCSFYSDSGNYQHYCNTNKAMVSTISSSFDPADPGETVYASFTDENIGELNYLHLDFSGSTDGWCFDKLSLLINDETDEWITCDFGTIIGYFVVDTDCSGGFGYSSVAIDLLSSDSPCYYDDSVNLPTEEPTGVPSAYPTANHPTVQPIEIRNYTAVFTTLDRSGCETTRTVDMYFANNYNCSVTEAQGLAGWCNNGNVMTTSTQTFTPAGNGLSNTVSFIAEDIGELTHLYLSGSTDAWCFDEFSILVDDTTNEWRTCSFSFMSYMTIDADCSGNGGVESLTIDISNSSVVCSDYGSTSTVTGSTADS